MMALALALCIAGGFGARQQDPATTRTPSSPRAKELVAQLASEGRRSRAAFELVAMRSDAVPALTAALGQPLGVHATSVLGRLGPHGVAAVEPLLARAQEAPVSELGPLLRALAELLPYYEGDGRAVFERLSGLIPPASYDFDPAMRGALRFEWKRTCDRICIRRDKALALRSVDGLIECLGSPHSLEREFAASLLGRRGPAAATALPALVETLEGTHPDVIYWPDSPAKGEALAYDAAIHHAAAVAIVRIAGEGAAAIPAHTHLLSDPDPETRRHAAMALGRHGAQARSAVNSLIATLGDPDSGVRGEAATALGMMGEAAAAALASLRAATSDDDPQVRARSRAAIRQIEG